MRIRIECEGAKNLPLESLLPTQDQLKELSQDNYAKLKNEILSEGFSFPFFVWQHNNENRILDGHHRRLVLIKMREEGYEIPDLPCAIVKANNEKEAARKLLAVTSQYAKITDQGLYEFMNKFDIDMSEIKDRFEFSDIDLDAFEDNFFTEVEQLPDGDEDEVPEVLHEPITKRGDIWLLGEHRLMCGDSTMIDDVEKLMNGEKFKILLTDPPFNLGSETKLLKPTSWKTNSKGYDEIRNSEWDKDFNPFDLQSVITAFRDKGAWFYLFTSNFLFGKTTEMIKEISDYTGACVWCKPDPMVTFLKKDWTNSIELCVYGRTSGHTFNTEKGKHDLRQWVFNKNTGDKRVHPCQKPVLMIENIIRKSSNENHNLLDLFLGSGSTLIACEKTNRKCYGMELDEHYCDVIINRWQNFTGKKAKLETGEYYNDLLDARQ